MITVHTVSIFTEIIETNTSYCPEVRFSASAGCGTSTTFTCSGLSANDHFDMTDGETYTVHPDVIVQASGMLKIYVEQLPTEEPTTDCTAWVTPTVHYTLESVATFAPTPAPTLPPATPLQTWVGDGQDLSGDPSWWVRRGRATFYSVEFTVTTPANCIGARMGFVVGCFVGINPPTCTGDSVAQNFVIDSTTITYTVPVHVAADWFWLTVNQQQLRKCTSIVIPTVATAPTRLHRRRRIHRRRRHRRHPHLRHPRHPHLGVCVRSTRRRAPPRCSPPLAGRQPAGHRRTSR